ncbi:MAG: radical SAM protein [Candidatus Portnoybacteria bacterium]|nr:radical SAM protein [Candidatus Portnoybacteria bacterium]
MLINFLKKAIIKVMRFLIVRPFFSVEKFYFPRFINESLGAEYLTAFLDKEHDVFLIDALAEKWNNYWSHPNYPEIIFQGIKPKNLLKKIDEYKPDIIGINWPFSTQNNSIRLTLKTIRDWSKDVPIVVGGPHPSANPEKILEDYKEIDIIVYGEGEVTTKEILKNKELGKINGIAFRKKGEIIINPPRSLIKNIDSIPFPKRNPKYYNNYSKQYFYEAVYLRLKGLGLGHEINNFITSKITNAPFHALYYKIHNKRNRKFLPAADIITSRGCPNHCTFCAIHNMWQHKWRMRSAENVLEEIDYLVKNFGIKHLNIQDDNFNISKERTVKICKGIVKNKYNITLLAPAGAFVPTLDKEVLYWLKKAGLTELRMSIESGNQKVLREIIKKNIDLKQVKLIVKMCKDLGIKTEGAFIFGIPGETIETMKESLSFAKKTGFDRIVKFIFQPFPNTELYNVCLDNNYLTKGYDPNKLYITGNKCYIKTDKFSPQDVLKIVNRNF